jgi:hydrophobic/amphiphilic exporter-1 (mainly G- bacteria), HAE1 family
MFLIRFALRNPYAVVALMTGLGLLGLAVVPLFPLDILPDFRKPVVMSFFSYPGLPTEDMEKSVTSRVERVLTLAGNVEHQESRTMPGACMIKVYFEPGTNPGTAMNDVVNLQASDMFHLPPGIEWPFTLRSEPANLPVVLAAISGEGLSEKELYNMGYYAVRNKMGGLKGVQIPHPFGGKFRQMMVYVDPLKLQSLNLSAKDVVEALHKSNLVLAAGTLKMGDTEYQVHPLNTLPTTEEIEAVPIALRGGRPILIRDVGYAQDDAALQYNIVRVNGVRSVYCPLLREPGENTIAVVDRIREGIASEIPKMRERGEIPATAQVDLVGDQSSYIRNAIRNLGFEVGLGALLVTLVVVAFLRQFAPTLVIIATIFFSILIGALGFYFTGQSINVMTLGGIALAIGTVVDAGIVVVENIVRHLRMGKTPHDAAHDGAGEVAGPVLAGTITTIAVFVPAVFLTGMIRFLFEPLAIAATLTIGASYFVAMTVVPAYCARFLRSRANERSDVAHVDEAIPEPTGWYANMLRLAIGGRWVVIGAMSLLVAASLLLYPRIGTELFPMVDAGTFEIRLKTTPGLRLEEDGKLVAKIEETIKDVIPPEEIVTLISNIGLPVGKGAGFSTILSSNSGPDTAFMVVNLVQTGRHVSTEEYITRLRARLAKDYPRDQFLFVGGGIVNAALNEGVAAPIDIQISAGSLEQIRTIAEEVVQRVKPIQGAADVQIAQALDYPQFDIEVDRIRAKYLGISQDDVAKNVLTALSSSVGYASTIWIDPKSGTDYFMGVQYATNEARSLDDIHNMPLSFDTPDGRVTVPLSNVANVRRVNIPAEIAHYNIARVYDVFVNVEGRDVGSVAADVDRALAGIELPLGASISVRGPVATMKSGAQTLGLGLLVAVILVYLVMLAQFRSFVDPLIIMLAVPLGITGVLAALYFTGTTFNIQSLMGTLMMIGVVVNNSILIVEFANQLRARGMSTQQAALAAAQIRLRPILMTSLTLVASMLPLAFHFAPGGEAMIPLARALLGGIMWSRPC